MVCFWVLRAWRVPYHLFEEVDATHIFKVRLCSEGFGDSG